MAVFYTSPCIYLEIDAHNLFFKLCTVSDKYKYLKAHAQYPASAEMILTLYLLRLSQRMVIIQTSSTRL